MTGCGSVAQHEDAGVLEVGEGVVKVKRRFADHIPIRGSRWALQPDHPAATEGRSLFPKNVKYAGEVGRLLKSGEHSRKLGSHIAKGALRGLPIYQLTLHERSTCPRSCRQWLSCYGNRMQWPRVARIEPDDDLLPKLAHEIAALRAKHERFMVRLHLLGDFYSVAYVNFWQAALAFNRGLHVFGYTAHRSGKIATAIARMNRGARCWIRTSDGDPGEFRAIVVENETHARALDAIVCPAQTGRTDCCGTCALCWATPKTIAFLRH